jgi:protein-disulfide isomerase
MRTVSAIVSTLLLAAGVAAQQQGTAPPPARPAHAAPAVSPAAPGSASAVSRKVEAYIRNLYALGPRYTVKVGEPQPTPIPGMQSVSLEVSAEGQSNTGIMFVSDDGRYLLQGDLSDMQADPFAKNRAGMDLAAAPSRGPANAKIVAVEYGDFQCPSCRRLSETLRAVYPDYPQVRFVFRDFPLTQIHVWAMTAAIAGRCIYHKNADAFWTYSDYIYDHQDRITAENVWDTVLQQGLAAGYDEATFKSCMADPAMKAEIEKSMAEGVALKIGNTPTIFINGRRLVGGEREPLTQYIDYELARAAKPKP